MGPEASCNLYFKIIKAAQEKHGAKQDTDYPPVVLYSLPLLGFDETGIVNETLVLTQLHKGIDTLNKAGCDFIVIPCNTVHYFIDELREQSKIPILSIIEETVKRIKTDNIEKIGLLASETTLNMGIYNKLFEEEKISFFTPRKEDYQKINQLVLEVMGGSVSECAKSQVINLVNGNVQGVVLGCTELPLTITQKDFTIPVYDTLQILAEAALDYSLVEENLINSLPFFTAMNFKQEILKLLEKATKLKEEEVENLISIPPDPKLGDYAFPCFKLGKNPKEAADKLKKKIKLPKFLSKTEVVGPYLNFFLNEAVLAEETLDKIFKEKEKYGKSKSKKEKVMIEFFHANTHKGVHIGHLRNICLGAAIANLQEAIGKKVIRANYQGDIGPHVAKCLWGYLNLKEKEPTEHKGIWLGKIYAKASAKVKESDKAEKEIKELNKKLYLHDKSVESIWQKTRKWCIDDFDDFYKQFGVKYDRFYFESEADTVGKEIVADLLKQGIAEESEGAIIVDLKKFGLSVYVAITGQGEPTYQGKELGLAAIKQKEFKFDKSLHVVGSEQNLFFQQVFKTYELMKSPMAGISTHISYGLVMLPEGKMSSREGTMILYDNLYNELFRLSKEEIVKRHKHLSKKEVEDRAQMITFGALKYSMIARENHKNLVFDWEKALDFEGDTGPYIQYAHARCASILRKAKEEKTVEQKINTKVHFESLSTEYEKKVILHLSKFTEIVFVAAEQYKPYLVAKYCLDLAQHFNEFYHNCPVISDLTEVMHARLLLVVCVKQVLENGLGLLGIKAPEEM